MSLNEKLGKLKLSAKLIIINKNDILQVLEIAISFLYEGLTSHRKEYLRASQIQAVAFSRFSSIFKLDPTRL